MKFIRAIGFCRCCGENVVILRRAPLHGLHLLLSGLTAGLWVVFWLRSTRQSRAWRCSQCGRVVLNGAITPLPTQAEPPVRPAGRRLDLTSKSIARSSVTTRYGPATASTSTWPEAATHASRGRVRETSSFSTTTVANRPAVAVISVAAVAKAPGGRLTSM